MIRFFPLHHVQQCNCSTSKVISEDNSIIKGHIEKKKKIFRQYAFKNRRGRSAPINMVITSTGAGKAVTKVIPSLKNKLTANAIRVPTPNGSLAIINLDLKNKYSVHEVNELIRNAALEGSLVNQIKYSMDKELVSSDIIGSPSFYFRLSSNNFIK